MGNTGMQKVNCNNEQEEFSANSKLKDLIGEFSNSGACNSLKNSKEFVSGVVSNTSSPDIAQCLERSLDNASEAVISTAFINASAINPLNLPIKRLLNRGGEVRILTSLMNWFNKPQVLKAYAQLHPKLQLRIYAGDQKDLNCFLNNPPSFHIKAYLFNKESKKDSVLVVGSANFTAAGLGRNIEWAYVSRFESNLPLQSGRSPFDLAMEEFNHMWSEQSLPFSDEMFEKYSDIFQSKQSYIQTPLAPQSQNSQQTIHPNFAQAEALQELANLRLQGEKKAAVIAATGVGKTYLAAFDVSQTGAKRILFLAHRETILQSSKSAFENILGSNETHILQGSESLSTWLESEEKVVFGMVQTFAQSQVLEFFPSDYFDYIVLDEFHHSAAKTYTRILNYFQPDFLLGLTATPERADGQDVLALCDYNVAYEVRLFDAIERELLVPFQYYAIYDPTDYAQIKWTGAGYNERELEKHLSQDTRAELIINNLNMYPPENGKLKCLAFCSNTGHARWMSKAFNYYGINSEVVLGETPNSERRDIIEKLQSESAPLEVICSVDVFSEGIDIPALTHVIMLRPTLSFTVFLQQLGRGLRLYQGKPFLTVLDFVGNYRRSYVAPLALQGQYTSAIENTGSLSGSDFKLPEGCHLGADHGVVRIWQDQLRKTIKKVSPLERLKMVLDDIVQNSVDGRQLNSIADIEPEALAGVDNFGQIGKDLKQVGGWLRLRMKLEIATEYENSLIDTPGELFLKHVEHELSPQKSYKMTILKCLLRSEIKTTWSVSDLAECFLKYYLSSRHKMQDWPELARSPAPESFDITKVEAHIKKMPLNYLSDKENSYFALDKEENVFSLKPEVQPYWLNESFRNEVKKRISYAEALYFWRKNKG